MHLETYERSILVSNAEIAELSGPIFNAHEINMPIRPNAATLYEVVNRGDQDKSSNDHQPKPPNISINSVSRITTKIRSRKEYRPKSRTKLTFRRNNRRKSNHSSIPIRHYNSLRIMVPSIASNRYTSKVSITTKSDKLMLSIEMISYA